MQPEPTQRCRRPWTRQSHTLLFADETNILFAALLLGLQRLETDEILPLAHHSMLEDMLEGWTLGDNDAIVPSAGP